MTTNQRSSNDMVPCKKTGLRELALFAGAGGGILGGLLCRFKTACAVEIEEYPRSVLLQRQLEGILPRFPIWDDVRTFDGNPWRGKVDIITGGFPCQDISAAGTGTGLEGARSGLWKEMARIIGEVRPRYVLVENSPLLTSRGLDSVLMDLAQMGYDARWGVLGAIDAGAPHKRERAWVLAHAQKIHVQGLDNGQREVKSWGSSWWASEPPVGRVADGVAHMVDRLKALGNGQVPAVVKLAWDTLNGRQ